MRGNRGSRSFVVAVTGHTCFDGCQLKRINELVKNGLSMIQSMVAAAVNERNDIQRKHESAASPRPMVPRLAIISCVAAGADQIVAQNGLLLDWRLKIVLPGEANEYRDAMKIRDDPAAQEAARAEFDRLLHETDDIVHLKFPLPAGDDDSARNVRHIGYAAATKYMLRRCDLLIAIVDVINRTTLGESGNAIRWAIRAGRPVLWIDPTRPEQLRWLSHLSADEFTACEHEPRKSCVVPDIEPAPEPGSFASSRAKQPTSRETVRNSGSSTTCNKVSARSFSKKARPGISLLCGKTAEKTVRMADRALEPVHRETIGCP